MAGGFCHRPFSVLGECVSIALELEDRPPEVAVQTNRVCKIFWLLPPGGASKQVTKLGNADGLLIH
jgi:hypothetical protein